MPSSPRFALPAFVVALALLFAPDARAFSVRSIDLKINDLVSNPVDGLLYVSVPGVVPGRGNTVTLIDPKSGDFVASIPVGSEPSVLALSDDGGTLYVGLNGAGTVQRVNLHTRAVELDIPLPTDSFFGPMYAADLAVMPGRPNTVAVSLRYSGVSPSHAGVAIYDDAVQRPTRTPGHTGSNRITFGATADRLYGLNIETTEYGFRRMQVDANGVTVLDVTGDLIPGWPEFEWFAGRIYSNGGRVIDPEGKRVIGTFPVSVDDYDRTVAPDNDITYFVSRGYQGLPSLSRYDSHTFALVDRRTLPATVDPPSGAVRWGAHGLAYLTFDYFSDTGQLFILDGIDDPPNADLSVSILESRDPSPVFDYVTYTVVVRNLGSDGAADAQLTADWAGGYDLYYAQSPRGSCFSSGGGETCPLGSIAPGDSVVAAFTFQPQQPGQLTFHVVASSQTQDFVPGNNQATETTQIIPPPPQADLFVLAGADSAPATVGRPLVIDVAIGNRGGADAVNARLESQLSGVPFRIDAWENAAGTCGGPDANQNYVCALGTIPGGSQARVRIHLTPLSSGYLVGSFHVSSDTEESTPYDNHAGIYVQVLASPESRIDDLIARVQELALKNGPEKTLTRPLEDARAAVVSGDAASACADLRQFEDMLNRRVGRSVTITAAFSLIAQAETIREMLGCDTGGRSIATPRAQLQDPGPAPVAPQAPRFGIAGNPTSAIPRVWFDLGRAGRAKVSVYDVRGRLVQVLADGAFGAGTHELSWTTPAAPGVYFYRFEPEGGAPTTARAVVLP